MREDNETRLGERPAAALSDRLHAMIVEARAAGALPEYFMQFNLTPEDWKTAMRLWTHTPLYTARRTPRFMGVPCVLDREAHKTIITRR